MQPSTMEQVKEANVVICTSWSYERTLVQVERAWKELIQDLEITGFLISNI